MKQPSELDRSSSPLPPGPWLLLLSGGSLLLACGGDGDTASDCDGPAVAQVDGECLPVGLDGDADTDADTDTDTDTDADTDADTDTDTDTDTDPDYGTEPDIDYTECASPGAGAPTSQICSNDCFCWSYPLPGGDRLWDIWGTDDDDVWVSGEEGLLLHWDGAGWLAGMSAAALQFDGIAGAGSTLWWYDGNKSDVYRYDGSAIQSLGQPAGYNPEAIGARSDGTVYVANSSSESVTLASDSGTGWDVEVVPITSGYGVEAIHAGDDGDIWVVGQDGLLLHYDGATWTEHALDDEPDLYDVDGSSSYVVIAGRDGLWHWDGATLVQVSTDYYEQVDVIGPGDVVLLGNSSLEHWDGADTFEELAMPDPIRVTGMPTPSRSTQAMPSST